MKLIAIFVLLFSSLAVRSPAGWVVDESEPGGQSIQYSTKPDEGYAMFNDAVKKLVDQGKKPHGVALHTILGDKAFEDELAAVLERDSPREWHEALKSAGNMHNPKMIQLGPAFRKAILATTQVREMEAMLANHGLRISRVSYEELQLLKTDQGRRFIGFVWLIIEDSARLPKDKT